MISAIMFIFLLADSSSHYAGLIPSEAGQDTSHVCSTVVPQQCSNETIRTHIFTHEAAKAQGSPDACLRSHQWLKKVRELGLCVPVSGFGFTVFLNCFYYTNLYYLFIFIFAQGHSNDF